MVCLICSATESKKWVSGKCITCWNREYYHKNVNKNKEKERNTLYYQQHKESIKKKSLEWAKQNKDKTRSYVKKWTQSNQHVKNMRESERRSIKRKIYLSKELKQEIVEIYKNCPKGCHVDHIVPLRGKEICGLHVPWNLQYLSPEANLKKGNRMEMQIG